MTELDVFRSVIARLAYHSFHAYFLQFVYSLFPVYSNLIYINKWVSQSVNELPPVRAKWPKIDATETKIKTPQNEEMK